MMYRISVGDKTFEVEIGEMKEGIAQVNVNGEPFQVVIENYGDISADPAPSRPAPTLAPSPPPKSPSVTPKAPASSPVRRDAPAAVAAPAPAPKKVAAKGEITAPIPGRIMDIKVKVGDSVSAGQTVATMEAMKMENNIASKVAGVVAEIRVQKDSEVATGQVIMVIG